jgi:hypothetical protein
MFEGLKVEAEIDNALEISNDLIGAMCGLPARVAIVALARALCCVTASTQQKAGESRESFRASCRALLLDQVGQMFDTCCARLDAHPPSVAQ